MKRDILLCIDLQAYLQTDDLVDENKPYYGTLTLDDNYNAQFVERPGSATTRRNLRIFDGRYITLTYRPKDGHIRFNFKEVDFGGRFNPMSFAIGVMKEIIMAFKCLGEEADWRAEKENTGD